LAQNPPNDLYDRTAEKQVTDVFFFRAKVARWVSHPLPFNQVIFGKNNTAFQEPEEDFNFVWDLSFPNMFKVTPSFIRGQWS